MEKGQGIFSEDSGSLPQQTCRDNKFTGHSYPTGKVQVIGDIFQFTVDVSEFCPEDVIITISNNLIEVHAEKLGKDGTVTNTFSHQCKLPSGVDPISVTMTMESSGALTVRAHRLQEIQ
ncbi:heat shock protein beta-7-like isoform X1 [Etheostoma spectabile]|uniref:heat shock protein beta-7-like isoform X1 n=1 Tax=Etheostoma spectabile TaxID=54343 RepID=UPI0013AEF2EE|nr:heat shock protein beta-7-like isoform X1 [Etheostoma spectabile]